MSDKTGKRVTFKRTIGGETVIYPSTVRSVDYTNCDSTAIGTFNGGLYYVQHPIQEVIAKLNAAMNPPGPGDVTVRDVEHALPNGHTATIYHQHGKDVRCPPIILCHIGGCNDGKPVACARNHGGDPLAAIASLKPAPDPRDELQKSHDAMVAKLRDIVDAKRDWLCGMGDILGPAECLVAETTKGPAE